MIRGAKKQSRVSKKWILVIFACYAVYSGGSKLVTWVQSEDPITEEPQEVLAKEPVKSDPIQTDYQYTVQEGDVLSDIFSGYDIPYAEIVTLGDTALDDNFGFTKVQPGKIVYFNLNEEGSSYRLQEVIYERNLDERIVATQSLTGWVIESKPIEYEYRTMQAMGSVQSSLYQSATVAGLDERVILELADTFAWDIDFARDTRSGDEYKVIYEARFLDDAFVSPSHLVASQYVNRGVAFYAFRYELEDGTIAYFDEEGNALEKAFLKAPVNYRYVSSGFSNARFHPVTGTVMPHNGVDYAADHGVPIISVADGVVSYKRYHTAYGNQIEIRHSERYSSQYAHMSGFVSTMNVGDRVKQGDVIGYVGSTGWSTGPHVHFSMTEYGTYKDPGTIDVPEGVPVPEAEKEAYLEYVQQMKSQLESLTQ